MALREHVRSHNDPRPAFFIVRLPDDPRIEDPSLRSPGETFRRGPAPRSAAFKAMQGRPLSEDGNPFSWVVG